MSNSLLGRLDYFAWLVLRKERTTKQQRRASKKRGRKRENRIYSRWLAKRAACETSTAAKRLLPSPLSIYRAGLTNSLRKINTTEAGTYRRETFVKGVRLGSRGAAVRVRLWSGLAGAAKKSLRQAIDKLAVTSKDRPEMLADLLQLAK